MLDAQRRVQTLQQQLGVLDPVAEGTVIMNQVAELERQLAAKRLELSSLFGQRQPVNQSRVAGVKGDVSRITAMFDETAAS